MDLVWRRRTSFQRVHWWAELPSSGLERAGSVGSATTASWKLTGPVYALEARSTAEPGIAVLLEAVPFGRTANQLRTGVSALPLMHKPWVLPGCPSRGRLCGLGLRGRMRASRAMNDRSHQVQHRRTNVLFVHGWAWNGGGQGSPVAPQLEPPQGAAFIGSAPEASPVAAQLGYFVGARSSTRPRRVGKRQRPACESGDSLYAATPGPWKFHRRCPTHPIRGLTLRPAATELSRLLAKTITDIFSLLVRSAANRFLPAHHLGRSTAHHCCLNVA